MLWIPLILPFSHLHTGKGILTVVHLKLSLAHILSLRTKLLPVFFDLLHFVQHACSEFRAHEETRKE